MMQAALADALGYSAAALVLWTFSLNSMRALRVVAIASNLMFIAYGAAAQLWPVLLLHAILLPLNGWRLWQLGRAGRSGRCRLAARQRQARQRSRR